MGRHLKTGLDYFPTDVDFFNDEKIEFISAKFGLEAEAILFRLLAKIYRNGYHCEWNEDVQLIFVSKLKSKAENVTSFITSIIEECFRRDFFDRDKFEQFGILTSRGIQRRYIEICRSAKRKNVPFEINYGLIDINSDEISINSEEMPINSGFSTQSKVKKSKVKERKVIEEEETKTPEEKTESAGSSRDFETPNFEEKESVVSAITNLFDYIGNSKPDYKAEIEPVYEAIHDKRQGMTPDITYPEIIDSFVIMKRKDSVKTDFLLGIIRNKLNKKFSVLQETKTTINQNISNRIRAETSAKERADEAERISEKVRYYREFYEKNEEIFSAREKLDILKYLKDNSVMNLARVIDPKTEEMITL